MAETQHLALCSLATWRHTCSGGIEWHHIVNRGKLQKNPYARAFAERSYPELFMAQVCHVANVSRLADGRQAQAILMRNVVALWGREHVEGVWESFLELWKPGSMKSLDAILSALPADAPRPVV